MVAKHSYPTYMGGLESFEMGEKVDGGIGKGGWCMM